MSFAIHRPVTGNGLHQQQPVFRGIVENDIWHLTVGVHFDAQPGQECRVEVSQFFTGVPGIDQHTARCKARGEILDDCPDQLAMLTRAQGNLLTRCNLDRDLVLLALPGVTGNQRFPLGQGGR